MTEWKVLDRHSNFQGHWEPSNDITYSCADWSEEYSKNNGCTDLASTTGSYYYGSTAIPRKRYMVVDETSASALDIDEALQRIGTGPFQSQILVAAVRCSFMGVGKGCSLSRLTFNSACVIRVYVSRPMLWRCCFLVFCRQVCQQSGG